MKTPEEIATEVTTRRTIGTYRNGRSIGEGGFLRAVAVAAIEADRKQRNPGSASERVELARGVLDSAPGPDRERALASVVRLFIEQPRANESCAQIARRIMDDRRTLIDWRVYRPNEEQVLEIATRAASEGMDAAFESWEPDDYAEPESVIAALRRALIDRENVAAGNWVSFHEQKIWDSMIGPLLDRIEVAASLTPTLWEPSGEPLPDAAAETARFDHDVEQAIRSEARSAIMDRRTPEFDEHDPRL